MNLLLYQASFDQCVEKVIFFSCSIMYPGGDRPLKETDLDLNDGIYPAYLGAGWTKVYLEKMCDFYSRQGRTKFVVIRHSNTYGPYDKYDLERSHMFGANITKVMTAKDSDEITVWGTGQEKRDLVYISDVVDFVELAMAKQSQENFDLVNVGCGEALSVNDIISKIILASGKNLSLTHNIAGPTIPVSIVLDITRAKNVYGWRPKVSLDTGIAKTIDWYRKNLL
ncbi:MAG: NAD-dependent epimerase/dehydratase family protein [Candidatus Yanofskybacteria bacterium]|nr:NAD-dependent epimerase/dehydratase family protein [Candidatus Yanofskybacteria bacterium]